MENQYFPLTACPSLLFISSQVSAGSSWIEPRGTERLKKQFFIISLPLPLHSFQFMNRALLNKVFLKKGGSAPTPNPLLCYIRFWQIRYPFRIPSVHECSGKGQGGGGVGEGISGKNVLKRREIKHIWTELQQTYHYTITFRITFFIIILSK